MRGVTFNHEYNLWRSMLSIEGREVCKYFKFEYDAVKYCILLRETRKHLIEPGSRNSRKKSNARAKDLPVGLHQSFEFKRDKKFYYIRCHLVRLDGRVKTFTAYFGESRSRKKAIQIVKDKRLFWVLENNDLLRNPY